MTVGVMAEAYLTACQQSHEFEERRIPLSEEAVKVGRSVARLKPNVDNAIFDCKVLSRNHAVLWYEDQRFYVKDTKSSNGTFVNNQRLSKGAEESPPKQIFSGDIIQFGVEIAENTKKVTHGCIVALIRLHHPDKSEALAPEPLTSSQPTPAGSYVDLSSGGVANACPSQDPRDVTFTALEVFQLQQYLREAAFREQAVESKLVSLQELIVRTQDASESSWQSLIDEDRLLARIEMLEAQLNVYSKSTTDDKVKEELLELRNQQGNWELQTKESLRRALEEKMEALKEMQDVERSLHTTESECSQMRRELEAAHTELNVVNHKHTQSLAKITQASQKLEDLEVEYKEMQDKFEKERMELEHRIKDSAHVEAKLAQQIKDTISKAETDESEGKQFEELNDRLKQTQAQAELYKTQIDSAHSQINDGKVKMSNMQNELERAWEEIASSNKRAQILDENIRKSNDQMGTVIDLAAKDLNAQLEEALYQNDRSEHLVTCLKEFASQLEGKLRSVMSVGDVGESSLAQIPVHVKHNEIMTSSDGSLPPSDPCSDIQSQYCTVDVDNQLEYLKDELAKAVQSQILAETELKKYRDDLISSRNGQRKGEEELHSVRLQLRAKELLLLQSDQTLDRINDQLHQEQVQKHRALEDYEAVNICQTDLQKKCQLLEMESEQLKNKLDTVQENLEFERSVKSTGAMDCSQQTTQLHKQVARNRTEFAKMKEECSSLRKQFMTVESEMKASRKENSRLSAENRKLGDKYGNLEKMKDAVDNNEKTWRAEVCAAKVDVDCTKSQLNEALQELERLSSHRNAQDMELTGLKRRLSLEETESLEDLALKTLLVTGVSCIPVLILVLAVVAAFLPWLSGLTGSWG